MNPDKQIKALAELDGIELRQPTDGSNTWDIFVNGCYQGSVAQSNFKHKPYLTSYDAIIPLIQKLWQQNDVIGEKVIKYWYRPLLVTPAQLAEALLRAHNLWEE